MVLFNQPPGSSDEHLRPSVRDTHMSFAEKVCQGNENPISVFIVSLKLIRIGTLMAPDEPSLFFFRWDAKSLKQQYML